MVQFRLILQRLRKPTIMMSVASQILTILILCGIKIDEAAIMTIATALCALLSTIGILSSADIKKKNKAGDVPDENKVQQNVLTSGSIVCKNCGTVNEFNVMDAE